MPTPGPEPDRPGDKLSDCVQKLLASYFPGLNLGGIRIHEGIPGHVPMKDAIAYTDTKDIYFKKGYFDQITAAGIALIGHEVTHVKQYTSNVSFEIRYGMQYLRNLGEGYDLKAAYRNMPFEKAAQAMGDKILKDLQSKFGNKNPCP